ncbi:phage tail protein [Rhizobium sp. S163]|uniref:phage tail protein n=1 Tax=Rhizobium sp. S163 TaxID=3055039 RepID=UPI0025A93B60|nr:phage tail protein [Rhizobium sp. S163]MDM9647765.1 phage tail protein [Rhizobium sp. S163]
MSVFKPVDALISIGGAILYTVGGLNPQRLAFSSEARFPSHATPRGLHYQATGLGERSLSIEAKTFPHVMGGLDAYALLTAIHQSQAVVPLVRLKGNYLGLVSGLCVIQSLEADEERLHPFDGVGRQVDVTIGILMMPAGITNGSDVFSLGGLLG